MPSIVLTKTEKAEEVLRRFMYEHKEFTNQNDAINAILEDLYAEKETKKKEEEK